MTIRKTLMIAFVLASLAPSLMLAVLAFQLAKQTLRVEIERGLEVEASTISQDLDKMLFERLQNAQTWSQLEVMQDIQVGDVDKRLSRFLARLKTGYRDVYEELSCTNLAGRVVASSNTSMLGRMAVDHGGRTVARIGGSTMHLDGLARGQIEQTGVLPIDTDIRSQFNYEMIGRLQLLFDRKQIENILDQAGRHGRLVLMVDEAGKVIAASSTLRDSRNPVAAVPPDWLIPHRDGVAIRDGAFLRLQELTVGSSRSQGFQQFPGVGWTTLVIQPSREAFVPVRRMAWSFLALLVMTSSVALGFALLISGRIAKPITRLTSFTRAFKRDGCLQLVPTASSGEVGELTEAFVQTVEDLEQSRFDLIHASKLAVLGELSAVMAHEIRTPIGILGSSAQMLDRERNLSDNGRELVRFIREETERLNDLVATLLDGARTREPVMECCDLDEVVRLCIGLLGTQAEKLHISLRLRQGSKTLPVECDPRQITQALLNLIQNAMQVLSRDGHVEVSTHRDARGAVVHVDDDGPGIADDALTRVFDPFFTRRDGGIGLGLSVVRQIVKAHGGEIVAGRSTLGGARFTFFIPKVAEEQ